MKDNSLRVVVPDITITQEQMEYYGYTWEGMLPIQNVKIAEYLYAKGFAIYKLYEDDTEAMINDVNDIAKHAECKGLFGVEKKSWVFNSLRQKKRGIHL